ncbi:hypothetical protein AD951_00525 [Acetobacter malorum]|uniref:Major facilitator superfamily (MFS) profile domain-containing protein n=1 Tax=Acetobacter malorum TaxID=178901 RepID=A0A149V2R0_9PROT|nr:MFS transporter [Acetobacter malorum]KXV74478.1 hypothetical protein AD951_00525 [Acetobacter malorum]
MTCTSQDSTSPPSYPTEGLAPEILTSADRTPPRKLLKAVIQVVCGNMLEMYDFMVFGFYALAIEQTFFPSSDPTSKLMLALATFGAGFLMRPLGALLLGSYVDRIGRRKGLIVTLGLMATGTLILTVTPGYATIGLMAPTLVLEHVHFIPAHIQRL